jgi:myosin V
MSQVLARMKQLMVDNNTAASHSFLLDDDSSIPFSLDDIAALMEDKVPRWLDAICNIRSSC